MANQLLPCPLCGKTAIMLIGIRGGFKIRCSDYCIEQPLQHYREHAVLMWNRRAEVKERAYERS